MRRCSQRCLRLFWCYICDVKLKRSPNASSVFNFSLILAFFAGIPEVQLWVRVCDKYDHHQGMHRVVSLLIFKPFCLSPPAGGKIRWRTAPIQLLYDGRSWTHLKQVLNQGFICWVCWHEFVIGYCGYMTSPAGSNYFCIMLKDC